MPIKTLGSLGKIRVGRVTGNTHIFFFWPYEKFSGAELEWMSVNSEEGGHGTFLLGLAVRALRNSRRSGGPTVRLASQG